MKIYHVELFFLVHFIDKFVRAFPHGDPTDACDTLSPSRNHGLSIQGNESPYILLQTAVSFKPGQVINVTIKRQNSSSMFEGFVVQAFDRVSGRYIGRFLDADGLSLLDECSAVTNKNRKKKPSIDLAWVAPLQQRGDVTFRGTIVENKSKYYDVTSRLEPSRTKKSLFQEVLSLF